MSIQVNTAHNVTVDRPEQETASTSEATDASGARRWSAWMALVTCGCLPGTLARRTSNVSLPRAFAVHIAAALVTTFLVCLCMAIEEADGLGQIDDQFVQGAAWLLDTQRHDPWMVLLAVLGIAAAVEAGILVLAMLLTPWGARDEPMRASLRNALRAVWLQSVHAITAVLVVGTIAVLLSKWNNRWEAGYAVEAPSAPILETGVRSGSLEWQAWQKATNEWSAEWQQWSWARQAAKPYYLRHREPFVGAFGFAVAWWIPWALLRAVGVPRDGTGQARPRMCESCGYNLTAAPMDGRCPECGLEVTASLGAEVRPGTPWQHRAEIGRSRAWRRSILEPILRPRTFGRDVQLTNDDGSHRRFLLWHLPVIHLVGFGGFVGAFILAGEIRTVDPEELKEIVLYCFFVFGTMSVLASIGFTLVTAGFVGLVYYFTDKRNLMPASMQVAAYLVGYMIFWVAFAWLNFALVIMLVEEHYFRAVETLTGLDDDFIAACAVLVPGLLCYCFYLRLVSRGTAAARYANR